MNAQIQYVSNVINYSSLSSSGCNIFGNSVIVNNDFVHQTMVGFPDFDNTNKAVGLPTVRANGIQKVTEYYISRNSGSLFKAGRRYKVSVVAGGIATLSTDSYPMLGFAINNGGNGTNTSTNCNGPQPMDINANFASQIILNQLYISYPVYNFAASGNGSFLLVSSLPQSDNVGEALIKSITIEESKEFQIFPATVPVNCGNVTSVTLSANNPQGITGITSYVWNLGATPNGWLYNGSPAPATITTTGNSIQLSYGGGTTSPKNVSVTPNLGSFAYNTYTSLVNFNTASTFAISSNLTTLCSPSNSATCSLSNLPNNPIISWSYSPNNIASVQSGANNTLIVTPLLNAHGIFTATATVTNQCGVATSKSVDINITTAPPSLPPLPFCNQLTQTISPGYYHGYFNVADQISTSYTWTFVSKSTYAAPSLLLNPDGQNIEIRLKPSGSWVQYSLNRSNACGSSGSLHWFGVNSGCAENRTISHQSELSNLTQTIFPKQEIKGREIPSIAPAKEVIAVFPNPGKDIFNISLNSFAERAFIKLIKLFDQYGKEVKFLKTNGETKIQQLDLRNLPAAIYILQIFDGENWLSTKIIKQ